jgi:hypothetical protein
MAAKAEDVKEYLKIGLYVAGAYFGFKALKGLAETFGIIQTGAENTLDTGSDEAAGDSTAAYANDSPMKAFNGNYSTALIIAYNKKYGAGSFNATAQLKIGQPAMINLATQIFKAKGGSIILDDNEDAVYSAFASIQTQYQLSILSSVFNYLYKKDLLNYLKSFLDADELLPIINKVNKLPQYFK